MRNLQTKDLFTLSKIVKKMNIKNEVKSLAKDVTGKSKREKEQAENEMKADLFMLFVENISNAEQEIYKLLADLSGKSVTDIQSLEITELIKMLKDLFNQGELKSFLSTALK